MAKDFTIYFADRRMNITGLASTKRGSPLRIADDTETESVEVASATLELEIIYSHTPNIDFIINVGWYVLHQNEDGEGKFFTIINYEKNVADQTITLYLEDAGNDLINEDVEPYAADKAYNIAYYIQKFTFDSGFEIGLNELGNTLQRKLEWEGSSSATKRISSVATQFDHAELNFSFEIKGLTIVKKCINIYKKRGQDLGVTLRLNRDINNIISSKTIENLATALKPTGATPEGEEEPITLEGFSYDDGRFYVNGHHLLDRESVQIWSRYLSPDESGGDLGHTVKLYSYETTSQSELCNRAVSHLKKISQPEENFEVDIAILPKHCRVGDIIRIVDNQGELYLESRILELKRSRSNEEHTATLGEFLIKTSGIDDYLLELAGKIKDGKNSYLWIMYSENADGYPMTYYPNDKSNYLGQAVTNTSKAPTDYKKYKWTRFKGQTTYTWQAYADDMDGNGFSLLSAGKKFMGLAHNQPSPLPSYDPKLYKWNPMYNDEAVNELEEVVRKNKKPFYSILPPKDPIEGDTWFQLDGTGNNVIAINTRVLGSWKSMPMTAAALNVETLSALTANLGKVTAGEITGVTIISSKFTSPFIRDYHGSTIYGDTVIEEGTIRSDWQDLHDEYSGFYYLNPEAFGIFAKGGATGKQYGVKLSSVGIEFNNGGQQLILPMESLVPVPWDVLPLLSGFGIAESNQPRYRMITNLDGSKTVEFRGQVSGNFSRAGTISFAKISWGIPEKTVMTQIASSTGQGGRAHIDTGGNLGYINGGGTPTYISLDGLRYAIN